MLIKNGETQSYYSLDINVIYDKIFMPLFMNIII